MCRSSSFQVDSFHTDGFVQLDCAIPRDLVVECATILWRDSGCDPNDRATWTRPVIRLGDYGERPFQDSANTPVLHVAFDELVGPGRWLPRTSLGTFPIRFPSTEDPGEDGWHVDASFPGEDAGDYFSWRINVTSRGRALLMLFLFSDVGRDDAPTRIRVGSHLHVARILAHAGDAGLSFAELAARLDETGDCPEVLATGNAGTVYLCHPFLVHAAQPHRGTTPRLMAQPPLYPAEPMQLSRDDGAYSAVEYAIRVALGLTGANKVG